MECDRNIWCVFKKRDSTAIISASVCLKTLSSLSPHPFLPLSETFLEDADRKLPLSECSLSHPGCFAVLTQSETSPFYGHLGLGCEPEVPGCWLCDQGRWGCTVAYYKPAFSWEGTWLPLSLYFWSHRVDTQEKDTQISFRKCWEWRAVGSKPVCIFWGRLKAMCLFLHTLKNVHHILWLTFVKQYWGMSLQWKEFLLENKSELETWLSFFPCIIY